MCSWIHVLEKGVLLMYTEERSKEVNFDEILDQIRDEMQQLEFDLSRSAED